MGYKGENSGNYLSDFGGTSAACPQVAGVAALILAANPTLTGSQVKNLIINNATPMYNATNFGAGRLNAYKALSQAILPVSGVSAFCSSAVYTATNVPPGLTVTWSVSPAGIVSMTPSGNQVTLTKLSQGFFTLTATLSGVYSSYPTTLHLTTIPDCTAVTATMSGSCNGSYQTWFLSATPNMAASNWHWTVDNPSSASYNIFNPYAQSTYVSVSGGGGGISVTYTDPCGETSYREGTTIYSPCARKYAFVAYPNPANGQLSIKLNNEAKGFQAISLDNTTVSEGNTNFIAELYDGRGRLLKKSQTQNNESELTFNTSDLTNGTYYLHIKSGTDLIQKQVIIHH